MPQTYAPRRILIAGALASLMLAAALPAAAVNIPEGNAVTPGSLTVFHLRVTATCDGLPMDELEVTMPETVTNPRPEALAGWEVAVGTAEELDGELPDEADEEAAEDEDAVEPIVVRWSNGLLEDGLLLDFGIRARFPEEQDEVLEFPVVQRCGEVELEHLPTVTLTKRYGQSDFVEMRADIDSLAAQVEVLRTDVDQLQTQVGEVNVVNLRTRVGDTEKAVEDLEERVAALEEGEDLPEATPTE
jgi:uncharacterized protein YcnI